MYSEEDIREIVKRVVSELDVKKMESGHPVDSLVTNVDSITDDKYLSSILVKNPIDRDALEFYKETTPARIGVGRAGDRPLTDTLLRFYADHAMAVDSVFSCVMDELIGDLNLLRLQTRVQNKDEHLTRPDYGRELDEQSTAIIREKCPQNPEVVIIVSDGLSSRAIEANLKDILYSFLQGLQLYNIKVGPVLFVKYGRVGIMDYIGEILKPDCAVVFIGERPGMVTAESMSVYAAYRPHRNINEAERNVISNIHKNGTPPVEAGAQLASLVKEILQNKASGINLKSK